jgi:transposase
MIHLGVDLHKQFSFITAMDQQGNILTRSKVLNQRESFLKFLSSYPPSKSRIVLEATWNWYWLWDLLEEQGYRLQMAHPLKTKAIASARIKTDKIDSEILAHLSRSNLVPQSYVVDRETRFRRELIRYRASLVRLRATIRNKLHALVARNGRNCPYRDILGKKATAWLLSLALAPVYRETLEGYLRVVEPLGVEIDRATESIKVSARESQWASRLLEFYGIGEWTALLIVSEIGDIGRFPSAKHLCSYAGLVPSVHASGKTSYTGHITKQGSKWLRWALVEAAHHAMRKPPYQDFYQRTAKRRGKAIAKVAVARKLLKAIYHLLRKERSSSQNENREVMSLGRARCGVMVQARA